MATPKKDLRSSRKRTIGSRRAQGGRPGRALLLILLIMGGLTAGMFASGHTQPRLGIDLAGGTSITLSAVAEEGEEDAINPTNLNTAVNIIERRVNGLGVSEAEVQTQGDRNIIVNIPEGTDEQQAREQVGTTAELGFRPVLTMAAGTPAEDTGGEGEEEQPSEEPTDEPTDEPTGEATEEPTEEPSDEPSDEPTGDEGADSQSLPAPGAAGDSASTASYASYTSETEAPATEEPTEEPTDDSTEEPAEDSGDEGTEEEDAEQQAADLQARFDALDCSSEESRLEAGRAAAQASAEDTVPVCSSDGTVKYMVGPVAVPGTDVSDASAVYDSQTGQGWVVQMEFNNSGADRFADITAELATQVDPQNRFAIVLDGEAVSAPSVSERLGGGRAEISGSFSQESAEDLANILRYGALPLSFEEASVSTVSPTLGGEQLRAGLIAGAIGLALVVIYMLTYYRGLSLIAVASLLVSAVLTYTIMSLLGPAIGFALNLPAVCGAIVAIGITADSFIVYFERIRDEVREGRTLRPAVERAWPRARRTILVSDFVSFLAAAVLFVVTVGKVQGFAFTLGLTTALDVVVVFLFTKPLMTLLARRKFFAGGHPWSGLDPKRLGARPLLRTRRPAPVPPDPKEA
ncbi:protein translocase subunit SecD [Streptomyces sp. DSM 44917]|uniref:Protein translocase subunit SecD n=1 Tax=Streptomyces boetiae TaxID=3075541 RepID=A0ABU2LB32_9ACTN|nr:protein translocase subunit SecD [Streptomyces sp. DSM 44917]MDT0308796.1 protein translocase subunit SecD [Streptomyces sp. DSM 44917]